ncbi:TPA: signal transduction histidine-protein kinase/phosphatase UhpB [Photobacterium damselae]
MRNYIVTSICSFFLVLCTWFCLWIISSYFIMEAELAILFFPFAFRLGMVLHTPKKYWFVLYGAEWFLTISLAILLAQPQWISVLISSIASLPIVWYADKFYLSKEASSATQWYQLSILGAVIGITSLLNMLIVSHQGVSSGLVLLVSITGGLMIVPSCYLIWNYLFKQSWSPLTANVVAYPVALRARHVIVYAVVFLLSILAQLLLPEELKRFAPFCLAIPIILLAFRYGWQGALLGTLLNSIALIAVRSGVSNIEITDLMLSLSAQTLTGILLGIGVQRQRELNLYLRHELERNQSLSRQLVKAEESVRKNIARELHDEIGQNITAIRMQAGILKRVETSPMGEKCASMIEGLSLNVYDTTKGLLTQLRPKTLDDLGLKAAIEQLIFELRSHQMSVELNWFPEQSETITFNDETNVTLYRICQEALNNIAKYAQATKVVLNFHFDEQIELSISDNGIGFKQEDTLKGFGLRGMRERVQALGGEFSIISTPKYSEQIKSGTQLHVRLPQI